jgi:hypothetical protein
MSGHKKAEIQSLVKYSPLESDIGLRCGERVRILLNLANASHTKK